MATETVEVGWIVEHPTLGIGKVVGIANGMVHVFFLEKESRTAHKFRIADAGQFLTRVPNQSHPWLDHLPPFQRDGTNFVLAAAPVTHEKAVEDFFRRYPQGFKDDAYLGGKVRGQWQGERNYKLEARQRFLDTLGNGEGERLLAAGDVEEATRRLLRVAQINLLHPVGDGGPVRTAFADLAASRRFLEALFALLAVPPAEEPFERLVDALDRMPIEKRQVCNWPVATLFPFLAQPTQHLFVRPTFLQEAAQRFRFDLRYAPHPNWRTYSSVLRFANLLLDRLAPLGAQDFLDVQSFVYVTARGSAYNP